jgi:Arc/MetJ family transcription regulator
MRTNIVLDDELISEAFLLTTIKTKRELVDLALKEFVSHRKRLDLRDLKGMGGLADNYDYKKLRAGN